MPVGQAVIARTSGYPAAATASGAAFAASAASRSASARSMTERNSSGVLAARRASANSWCMRSFDSWASISRWVLFCPSGAAIMNMRSAGASSGAFHSTPAGTVMAASPGRLTAEVFACGIAMPSPTAVENSASRARIAFLYATVSLMLPEASWRAISWSMASSWLLAVAPTLIPSGLSRSVIFTSDSPLLRTGAPGAPNGACPRVGPACHAMKAVEKR